MITHIIATMVDDDGCLTAEGEAELDRLYATREAQVEDLLRERGNREAEVAGLRAVIAGLEARVDAEVEAIGRIDAQIKKTLKGEKFSCNAGVVTWSNSEALIVDDEEKVPEKYIRTKTIVTTSVDKANLKKDIKDGKVETDSAHIEKRENMKIKGCTL
jgi:hypothetical protein